MSVLCNNTNGTGGSWYVKRSLAGSPDLRAAHTLCMRTRFTSVATTADRFGINWGPNFSVGGSMMGRYAGATANQWNGVRHSGFTAATSDQATTPGYADTTTWRHFAMTYDLTNIRSYINGVLQNTIASATTRVPTTTNTDMIAWGVYQGVMCDVALFNRVLTDHELALLTNARFAPVLSKGDCIGFWPGFFNGITKDYSGRGNDLTLEVSTGASPAADNEDPGVAWALRRSPQRLYFVSTPASSNIDAAGTTQCTGAAAMTIERQIDAAGTTQVNGSANVRAGSNAAGSTLVTGAAAMTALAQLSAAGQTRVTGAAAMTKTGVVAAAGQTICYGLADIEGSGVGPGPGGGGGRVRVWRRGPRYGR